MKRDKEKPWLCYETSSWWQDLFGFGYYKIRVNTSHPEWIKQVLIPMIEKCKKYKIIEQ